LGLGVYKSQPYLPKGPEGAAWRAALKEAADAKKKKKAEEAHLKLEKEMDITRRVQAGENRSDIESELESEDPTEVGDDVIFSEEEVDREVFATSVECRDPKAASARGEQEVERCNDVLVPRKRATCLDVVGEWEAKWT